MSILMSLTPFIVFFALMRLVSPLAGLSAAFVASLLLCLRQWRRGEAVKVLEIGSLALFGALLLYTVIAAPVWTVATVRLAVDGGLLLIVLVSLLSTGPSPCSSRAKPCRRSIGKRRCSSQPIAASPSPGRSPSR
jgi:hypothetical protein